MVALAISHTHTKQCTIIRKAMTVADVSACTSLSVYVCVSLQPTLPDMTAGLNLTLGEIKSQIKREEARETNAEMWLKENHWKASYI